MKHYLTAIFIFLIVCAQAQDKANVIKATASYGVILENPKIKTMSFEYQRNIGLGIFAVISHSRGNGGTPINNLITDQEFERLSELNTIEGYGGIGSGFLFTFVQTSNYGLGVQKNVQLTNDIHFGLSAKGVYSNISNTTMEQIEYNSEGELLLDLLQETYSTRNAIGAEVGLHLMYNIKSYAYIGLSASYLTNPKLTRIGIFTSISF